MSLLCIVAAAWIDAHAHLEPGDLAAAAAAAAASDAAQIVLLTPPDTFDDPARIDEDAFIRAIRPFAGKLVIAAGGSTLNAMIQKDASAAEFRARAEQLLQLGAAGFGELTVEHFAGGTPYQSAPPDHPLLFLLAEIAGRTGAPIVLHMEALRENIGRFEKLLDHDPRAQIVWAHAGADNTGYRTPDLCRRLLKSHRNLSMEIKVDPRKPGLTPLLDAGRIRPDWLRLFEEFPDRFVIGSDQHHPGNPERWKAAVTLVEQLPAGVREQIGRANALRLYRRGSK